MDGYGLEKGSLAMSVNVLIHTEGVVLNTCAVIESGGIVFLLIRADFFAGFVEQDGAGARSTGVEREDAIADGTSRGRDGFTLGAAADALEELHGHRWGGEREEEEEGW